MEHTTAEEGRQAAGDLTPIGNRLARPLEDIRILAVEQYGAGPFGSMHLADLGADVIKIENPRSGGDIGRYVPPYQEEEDSLFFETFNRNKRSLSLDLSTEAGKSVFKDLVRCSDAVFSNLRGDLPQTLGITYDDLKDYNSRIVCVSVSGFGNGGPKAADPGYDYILQGMAGWMSITGEPDGPPTKSGLSLVDYSAGLVGALALLAAVHSARRTGVGTDCDVSLYDVAMAMLTYPATWYLNAGWTPVRTAHSSHPSIVPFQAFQGKDGNWFTIACAKEKFWRRMAQAIERPELAEDPRFRTLAQRSAHRTELVDILTQVFTTRPADYWIETLEDAGVPCGPVLDIPTALQHPLVSERQLIVETTHDRFGMIKQLATPVRVGDPSTFTYKRAPRRNEDADSILRNLLQYSAGYIEELERRGAFG